MGLIEIEGWRILAKKKYFFSDRSIFSKNRVKESSNKKIKKNKMAGGRQTTASSSLLMTFQKLP